MSKELAFTDDNDVVKYLDTTTSLNLALTADGLAFDLTNAKTIVIKIANDDGYIMDKSIDLTKITNLLNGTIIFLIDQEVMTTLVPDDYDIEVWVTMNDGTQAIFPSDGTLGFSIEENLMSDTGEVIPTITLNDFKQQFDDLSSQMENAVHNVQKGDKGDKGDTGQGLEIKDRVSSVSNLPSTANEGDGYLVNEELYIWVNGAWKDCGPIQGPQGIQGIQGKTGTGVSSTTIQYQISNSATTAPTGTWSNTLIATTQDNPFLWMQVTLNYDDGTSKSFYLVSSKGDKGDTGAKGQSVWTYPYDRGANRLASYWSDLKPTPTTDNPPKVNDTIVDLTGNIYQITNIVVGGEGNGGGTFDYGDLLTSIKGPKGDTGPVGAGLVVKGTVSNASQLPTTGNQEGYCYFVGTDLYVWDAGAWKNCGSVSPDLSNYVTVTDLNNGLSTKVNIADMRKPASDVAGIEEVNAKQDLIGYTPADDSKVVHNSAIDPSVMFKRLLTADDDVLMLDSGIYCVWGPTPKNYPTNVINYARVVVKRFSASDINTGNTIVEVFDAINNHLINIYQGSPMKWSGWQVPNSNIMASKSDVTTDITDAMDGTVKFKELAEGTDLFSMLVTDGKSHFYACSANATATTLKNSPANCAFSLELYPVNIPQWVASNGVYKWDYTQMVLRPISSSTAWLASISSDDSGNITHTDWVQVATSTDLSTGLATKADDSKVAHLSGANNFDTVPTVNNNPLLLASSLPSDLARTSQQTNFTDGLQKGGKDVATTADVTSAINSATSNYSKYIEASKNDEASAISDSQASNSGNIYYWTEG